MKTQSWSRWCWKLGLVSSLAICGAGVTTYTNRAFAQIRPDDTLSTNSAVTPLDSLGLSVDQIDQGTIRGNNLFHSFQEFNVGEGRGAYFTNPAGVENILSRVTGNNPSNILGTLGVTGGNANLFLLNPNGIVFGLNASLDVRGSFVATTANAIQFAEQGVFSASTVNVPPLLTVNPSAFLFNQIAARPITSQSTVGLQVPSGQSLLLLGGDVSLNGGRLNALGGRVELGGLAGEGTVGLGGDGNSLSLSFPNDVTLSDVFLTNLASVVVRAGGGGSITINAQDLDILGGSGLLAGVEEGLGSVNTQAGDITLNATGTVTIAGNGALFGTPLRSSIFNNVDVGAVGKGGNINIQAGSLLINGANLGSFTSGQGDAGSVLIRASDVSVADSFIFSNVGFGAMGKGGNIDIQARSLSLTNGTQLATATLGQGDAGSALIRASDFVSIADSFIFSNVGFGAMGKGGNIDIQARSLSLTDDTQLNAATLGQGDAGSVLIRASDSVSITNSSIFSENFDDTFNPREATGQVRVNNGGDIRIQAGSIAFDDAALNTSTSRVGDAGSIFIQARGPISFSNGTGILSSVLSNAFSGSVGSEAVGRGGNITIQAESLSFDDALLTTLTAGRGSAGSVFVRADDSISLSSDSTISSAVGPGAVGNGGDINIQTRSLSLTDGSQLRAAVEREQNNLPGGQGQGGSINIQATDSVHLAGVGPSGASSGFFTSTGRGAAGPAGNITVSTSAFRLADGAVVSAQTLNPSNGGTVAIQATSFDAANGSQVLTTTRDRGLAGNITVNVTDRVTFSGRDSSFAARLSQFGRDRVANEGPASGLFANTTPGSTGGSGSISINADKAIKPTRLIKITEGAEVTVNSQGTGNGGSLNIRADSLTLDNRAFLSAATASGTGGNIQLQGQDFRLRHKSDISTTAASGSGSGGNIAINTGTLVALEDSDITANAFGGPGGNVQIDAQGLFRSLDSDITASSAQGIEGVIEINTPDVDLQSSLTQLSANFVSPEQVVAGSCLARRNVEQGSFTITGPGGLPPSPYDAFSGQYSLTNVQPIQESGTVSKGTAAVEALSWKPGDPVQEAQGIIVTAAGRTIVGTAPQLVTVAKARDLVCDSD